MIETPPYLSPSSASTFESCPLRWKYKYIDNLPDPSGQSALVGSFAHLVLEKLCELPNRRRTLEQAKSIAKTLWPVFAEDEDYIHLDLDEKGTRDFKWQSWIAISGLWQLEDPTEVDVVSTEQKIKTHLGSIPFVGIIDRIDRIDNKLVISDYKSGKLPSPRWRYDKIQQVMLYAAAAYESMDEKPSDARLLYLGQKTISTTVTDRSLEKAIEMLAETWNSIETSCATESFTPKPGVLCGWCAFVESCPTGQEELIKRNKAGKLPEHAPARVTLKLRSPNIDKAA